MQSYIFHQTLTTAQHAKPKVMGQMEPSRAQFTTRSTVDKTYSNIFRNVSINILLRIVVKKKAAVDI